MISETIIKYIEDNAPLFTIGKNLFAEQSKGNQCVTVITRNLTPWPGMPENFRQADIEVEVKGYPMAEAHNLSEGILTLMVGMNGKHDSYSLRTVQPKQLPCVAHDGTYTFSFRVSYIVEGA